LIGFYGDNMQWLVPKYLEHSMQLLANNQEQLSGYFQSAFGNMFPFGTTLEEMGKQNLAMFERAMRLFSPFAQAVSGDNAAPAAPVAKAPAPEPVKKAPAAVAPAPAPVKQPEPVACATVTNITRRIDPAPVAAPAPAQVAPTASVPAPAATPMPNVQNATSGSFASADDMQQKIANLQRQLAELAKNRG